MEAETVYTIIGYVASLLVVISLAMSNVLRLRVINLAGALLFLLYGALITAWPIVATNAVIVVLDAYFLVKAATDRAYFSTLEVRPDSLYLSEFLRFYRDDIAKHQPGFDPSPESGRLAYLVLRDAVPAGAFLAHEEEPGVLRVDLDYVTPRFADFKAGRYLYVDHGRRFAAGGYHRVVARSGSRKYDRYLEKMGFQGSGPDRVLRVAA